MARFEMDEELEEAPGLGGLIPPPPPPLLTGAAGVGAAINFSFELLEVLDLPE